MPDVYQLKSLIKKDIKIVERTGAVVKPSRSGLAQW